MQQREPSRDEPGVLERVRLLAPPTGVGATARPDSSRTSSRGRPSGSRNRPGSANAWTSTVTLTTVVLGTARAYRSSSKVRSRCRCVAKRWIRTGPE